jgi:UPF0716 protein FxsA
MAASRSAIAGGFLMILPGFVTDLIGAALVLPASRPAATRLLSRLRLAPAYRPRPSGGPPSPRGDVIEGEIVDRDEPPR